MDPTPGHVREPTVDDLRVKLCYICREEERHDSPPQQPSVWTHPCKCTLVAHESCLLHWIKTQQRDFGRSRGDLKCPQCGELYEFEGFNPVALRIFNTVNRTLSRSGRVVTACCVGTIIFSSAAGVYLTCVTYGAFAVREFLGPDIFRLLLTGNPANWPFHAWFYLPMIPFSLVVSRTPLVVWTTSPLVPLLFPWPSSFPILAMGAAARGSRRSLRIGGRPSLWPPPPALVCALFPIVRLLYSRLRDRVIRAMVKDLLPTRAQVAQRRQRREQQGRQEQRRGNQQVVPQPLQQQQQQQPQPPQQPPAQPQQQHPVPPDAARRFQFQVGDQFAFEIAHIVLDHNVLAPADVPGPAPAPVVAAGDIAANGGGGAVVNNPADQQQQQQQQQPAQGRRPLPVPPVGQAPQRQQPPPAPQPQDGQQQRQQPPRAEPGQNQGQDPAPAPQNANDLGAVAARAIRVTGASLGRLVGGALLMPTIARMMGSMLLHISHVVPLVRIIIAPVDPPLFPPPPAPPSGPISALVGLLRGGRDPRLDVGPLGTTAQVGYGTAVLRGFLATSNEWATSDPVWWRNALGLGIFLVVKDGLKILHLWLAKRELEERHIKNRSFAGIDLTGLDLIERK